LLALVLIAAAGWEWGRLNEAGASLALAMGGALALGGGLALGAGWHHRAPDALWWAVTLLWLACGALALRAGPTAWPQLPQTVRWVVGLLALWSAWLALANSRVIGINFMLSLLCLVWMADVAAYFGGRALGRRKLALAISPGKSWEGVWSGMAGVLLLALFWMWLDTRFEFDSPSLYTSLAHALGWAGAALALLALCGLSVVGDLIESLVKRDPNLSYQLLKLVNSVAFAPNKKITSFGQAIALLGRRQLQRWLQLLLYARQPGSQQASSLLPRAAQRAGLMEALAKRQQRPREMQEHAFMVGMFSLLDQLFGMPVAELIEPLNLPDPVVQGLAQGEGPLGLLLAAVVASDGPPTPALAAVVSGAAISLEDWAAAQVEALRWAVQVSKEA
jgi:phosphatidate cytidylyltransferase